MRTRALVIASFVSALSTSCTDDGGSMDGGPAGADSSSSVTDAAELDDASELDGAQESETGPLIDASGTEDDDAGQPDDDAGSDFDAESGDAGDGGHAGDGATHDGSPDSGDAAAASACTQARAAGELLLELGPDIGDIQIESSRFLSTTIEARVAAYPKSPAEWTLWDGDSFTLVARGSNPCPAGIGTSVQTSFRLAAMRGNLLVTTESCPELGYQPPFPQLALRDATDGHVVGTLNAPYYEFGIARDGSYTWTRLLASAATPTQPADPGGFQFSSPTGAALAAHHGSYTGVSPYAAPGELRIANGPAGADVIEHISSSTGESSLGPRFAGTFFAWFSDGESFFTTSGSAFYVYAADGTQRAFGTRQGNLVAGTGDYYWSETATDLFIYKIGNSAPALTLTAKRLDLPVRDRLWLDSDGQLAYVDLRAETPALRVTATRIPQAVPGQYLDILGVTAAGDVLSSSLSNASSVGSSFGVPSRALLVQRAGASAPVALTCGGSAFLDLADDGTWAVATHAGQILTGTLSTRPAMQVLPGFIADLEIADDGRHMLVTAPDRTTASVYDLPSLAPVTRSGPPPLGFVQAGSRVFARSCESSSDCTVVVQDIAGTTTYSTFPVAAGVWLEVSPSGTRVAVGDSSFATYLYGSSGPTGATSHVPIAWLTDERLLEGAIRRSGLLTPYLSDTGVLVDPAGVVQTTLAFGGTDLSDIPLPLSDTDYIWPIPRVDILNNGARFYIRGWRHSSSPGRLTGIRDASTGAVVWSPTPPIGNALSGAANNEFILYPNGGQILAVPHP